MVWEGLGLVSDQLRGKEASTAPCMAGLCLLVLANPILKSLPWTRIDVSNRSLSDPSCPGLPNGALMGLRSHHRGKRPGNLGFGHGWVQDRNIPHHVSLSFSISRSSSLGPLSSEVLPERDFRRQLG